VLLQIILLDAPQYKHDLRCPKANHFTIYRNFFLALLSTLRNTKTFTGLHRG